MHGLLETNWNESKAKNIANRVANDAKGRILYAPMPHGTTEGTGCALYLHSSITPAKDEAVIYIGNQMVKRWRHTLLGTTAG